MLKKKVSEELTQRLVCYGTILLCLLYMLKFLKRYLSLSKSSTQQELKPSMRQSCLRISPDQSHVNLKPRRQRYKRRQQTIAEQWLPRDDVSHEHDFEECSYVATDMYNDIATAEKGVDCPSGPSHIGI